jgi:hypothetical protein
LPPHHHRTIHRRPPSSARARAYSPAPDILPRTLPSATAPTRCASCPRPVNHPMPTPAPAPVPAMPAATAPPTPDALCGLQMRVRGSLSVEGDERRVSGGTGARARRHGRRGSTASPATASPATARVRETGPWRHRPRALGPGRRGIKPQRGRPLHGSGPRPHPRWRHAAPPPPGASGRGPHTTARARHAALPAGRTRPLATMAAPAPSGSLR